MGCCSALQQGGIQMWLPRHRVNWRAEESRQLWEWWLGYKMGLEHGARLGHLEHNHIDLKGGGSHQNSACAAATTTGNHRILTVYGQNLSFLGRFSGRAVLYIGRANSPSGAHLPSMPTQKLKKYPSHSFLVYKSSRRLRNAKQPQRRLLLWLRLSTALRRSNR
jgi:hypothetical protein